MDYITVAQDAEQWNISDRRVRILCHQGKIDGVTRQDRAWMIPADAESPLLVLEGITIDKTLKDHLEAVGHRDAFLYVEELVKNKVPFSERIIKQIHTGADGQTGGPRRLPAHSGADFGCLPCATRSSAGTGTNETAGGRV